MVWSISCVPVTTLIVLRFSASFTSFIVLDNDSKTRSFLALEIGAGYNFVSPIDSEMSIPDGGSARRYVDYSNRPWEYFDNLIITNLQSFICRSHGR